MTDLAAQAEDSFNKRLTLQSLTSGIQFTWPTQAIPILEDSGKITLEEASYFSVMSSMGMLLASPLFALALNRIGRKWTLIATVLPQLLSWTFTALEGPLYIYYVARIFNGIANAGCCMAVSVYIAEVSTPKVRGTWGNALTLNSYLGYIAVILGVYYASIFKSAIIFSLLPILFLICMVFLPETPYYLISQGKEDAAAKSLKWLRRTSKIGEEFTQLKADVTRQLSESGTVCDLFIIPSNRKALLICTFLRGAQQFGGITSFYIYTPYIFNEGIEGLPQILSSIIFALLLAITNLAAGIVLDKIGRRKSMIISCFGCFIILCFEATYYYLKEETAIKLDNFKLVPLIGMSFYVLFYAIGLGIMPPLMLGELFSSSVKAKCLTCMNITYAIYLAVSTKLFQFFMCNFGMWVAFLFFAVCCFASTIISYFVIPETSGKSLEEIQQELKR